MFIFPWENNTGLPPVPFQHHSPLHTLNDISVNFCRNRYFCKTQSYAMQTNLFCLMKKINVDFKSFVVWVKPMSDEVFEPSSVHSRQFQTLAP